MSEQEIGEISSTHFDVKLDQLENIYSQDRDEISKVNLKYDLSSRKKDTASVTIELWLHWLTFGTKVEIISHYWEIFVVILQENFLLLRWRRNVSWCFRR